MKNGRDSRFDRLHPATLQGGGRKTASYPSESGQNVASVKGPVLCGDLQMRIDRDGLWYYHGSPIGRKELVRLFASVLRREPDGQYWLVTPAEKGRIIVEDAPFLAVELMVTASGRDQVLRVRTNVDDVVTIDADRPLRIAHNLVTGEPSPYILVRDGLEARLSRSVYYEVVSVGVEHRTSGETIFGVWSSGTFFPLGKAEDDDPVRR